MLLKSLLSPQYYKSKLDEFRALRQRAQDTQIEMGQMQSLLQLKSLLPPIPPAHLQLRVSGYYHHEFFLHGRHLHHQIDLLLRQVGSGFSADKKILDFGVGCGRTLIPLGLQLGTYANLYGADIDAEAIGWMQQHYPHAGGFVVNDPMPPMHFADATFDITFGISVFTHLPEAMQSAYLADIARITRPGGYVVLSIHGPHFIQKLPDNFRQQVLDTGFLYIAESPHTDGLPTFYRDSYQTHEYVKRVWSQHFTVLNVVPTGIDSHDAVLLQKPA